VPEKTLKPFEDESRRPGDRHGYGFGIVAMLALAFHRKGRIRSSPAARSPGMADDMMPKELWDVFLGEMTDGWCFDFNRIDTGSETVFALGGHRDGAHYIIISDELLPALLELRKQTQGWPAPV
jgi:hypothetical protein